MRAVMYEGLMSPRIRSVCDRFLGEGWDTAEYTQEGGWFSGMAFLPSEVPEGVVVDGDGLRRIHLTEWDLKGEANLAEGVYDAADYTKVFDKPEVIHMPEADDPMNQWYETPVEIVAWVVGEKWMDFNGTIAFQPGTAYEE